VDTADDGIYLMSNALYLSGMPTEFQGNASFLIKKQIMKIAIDMESTNGAYIKNYNGGWTKL